MNKIIVCFGLLALLVSSGCKTTKKIVYEKEMHDSIRIEYRDRLVRDTIVFELPAEYDSVETLDTISVLENTYSSSTASYSGGILKHSLKLKPLPIIVPVEVQVHDTIYYEKQIEKENTVETVEKKLTWLQKFLIKSGAVFISIIIASAILYIVFMKKRT